VEIADSDLEAVEDFAQLIRRLKAHDREAFARLYRYAVGPLYRYVAARLGSNDEAEELVQEIFVAALGGLESLRAADESGFLAWLFQIARNKLADRWRRQYRQPVGDRDAAELESLESPEPRPDELAEREDEVAEVRRAIEELTPEQREVIVCKYVLGYDNRLTARLVGKNVNAVNQLHHRALASLARLLDRRVERPR
jgi:RNA polymerase sigma-70 factor, ECF subfamily